MDEYRESSTKGKVYFYSFIFFGLVIALIGTYFFKLFPPQGTDIEQMRIGVTFTLVSAVINAVFLLTLSYVVYFLASSAHKHMQWPPPNVELPFRQKIKPIKNAKLIWLYASIWFFFLGGGIFKGFYVWHQKVTFVEDINQQIDSLSADLSRIHEQIEALDGNAKGTDESGRVDKTN